MNIEGNAIGVEVSPGHRHGLGAVELIAHVLRFGPVEELVAGLVGTRRVALMGRSLAEKGRFVFHVPASPAGTRGPWPELALPGLGPPHCGRIAYACKIRKTATTTAQGRTRPAHAIGGRNAKFWPKAHNTSAARITRMCPGTGAHRVRGKVL